MGDLDDKEVNSWAGVCLGTLLRRHPQPLRFSLDKPLQTDAVVLVDVDKPRANFVSAVRQLGGAGDLADRGQLGIDIIFVDTQELWVLFFPARDSDGHLEHVVFVIIALGDKHQTSRSDIARLTQSLGIGFGGKQNLLGG